MRISWIAIYLLLLICGGGFWIAEAQDGGTPQPDTSMTVHVVQRGESLFRIAERYGSSVEAVMSANNITDARFIEVGQRLLIPDAQTPSPAIEATHIVQVGETLDMVALRYGINVQALAARNNIVHGGRLFAGQRLTVNDSQNIQNALMAVQSGDSLLRISARTGVPLVALRAANRLSPDQPLFDEQTLIVPQQRPNFEFVNFPAPLVDLSLFPVVPIQGQSIGLQFEATDIAEANGSFMGRPFQAASIEGNRYGAILGIHAFAAPGIYSVNLNLIDATGHQSQHEFRIQVQAGDFESEAIDISADSAYLLENEVVLPELELVAGVMSGYTVERTFDGLMSLPVAGQVTSGFGTRRSYNGSPYNTFHGGVDYFAASGTPITAAADGIVVLSQLLQIRGNAVIIDHGWGVYTGYWHMSEIYVEVGQPITKGQPVGALGATGLGTGPHLHWEMWVHGVQVNPIQWLQQSFP